MAKTFETLFKLGAKYTGHGEFNKLDKDIDKVQKNAKQSGGKMSGAFAGATAGVNKFRGALLAVGGAFAAIQIGQKLIALGKDTFQAALDADKARQRSAKTLERTAKIHKLNAKQLAEEKKNIQAAADSLEKLGLDSETALVGLSDLSRVMKPAAIIKQKKAFADYLVATKGIGASEEDAAAAAEELTNAILKGKSPALDAINLTNDQRKAFKELSPQKRYLELFKRITEVLGGELERAAATTEGRLVTMKTAWQNLQETIGDPFVQRLGKFSDILKNLALNPKVQQAAQDLAVEFEKMLDKFDEKAFNQKVEEAIKSLDKLKLAGPVLETVFNTANQKAEDLGVTLGKMFWGEEQYKKMQDFWKMDAAGWLQLWENQKTYWTNSQAASSKASEKFHKDWQTAWDKIKEIWNAMASWWDWLMAKIASGLPALTNPANGSYMMGTPGPGGQSTPSSSGYPATTEFSTHESGPGAMSDSNTRKGLSATGPNLTTGAIAVGRKAELGTIYQDAKTGKHYMAVDRHGNPNPNVKDVYKTPQEYGRTPQPQLKTVGKIPQAEIPKTAAGLQKYLEDLDAKKKGSSLNNMSNGMGRGGRGSASVAQTGRFAPTVIVNATSPSSADEIAAKVKGTLAQSSREWGNLGKRYMADEDRLRHA